MLSRNLVVVAVTTFGAACGRSPVAPEGTPTFAIRFSLANQLLAPVTVAVDGVPHVALLGGGSTNVAVPATAKWLTWTSAKPSNAGGVPIPDDVGEVKIAVSGISTALEISNVINNQTYITAGIVNLTSAAVSIGVYNGTTVMCASELPAAVGSTRGFTQIGYYRLQPATEIRAYRSPSDCTGAFVSWSSAQLRSFQGKTGLLTLTLDSPP